MRVRLDAGAFSPEKRALLEKMLRAKGLGAATPDRIPRRADGGAAPLTHLQEGLWFLDRLEPGTATYNIPGATRIVGPLDAAAMVRALREIVARHEALRTTFPEVGGVPRQVPAEAAAFELVEEDLSSLPAAAREPEALCIAHEEAQRPFDLANGPVFRVRLLRLSDTVHVLVFCIHHIVADGWSFRVFTHELSELYLAFAAGLPSPLPPLPIQFGDFAGWQREHLVGEELERFLTFWRGYLDGVARLELPHDRPRPAAPTARGAHHSFGLTAELSDRLRALGREVGSTPFVTLLAAFEVLLHTYSGQEDVVVGSPVACRNRSELEDLIGYFVNVLPFRTDLSGNPSFRELLGRVDVAVEEVHKHQDIPFGKLVEELKPAREPGANPVYQVEFTLLTYEHAPAVYNYGFRSAVDVSLELGDLTLSPMDVESGVSKFDLVVLLWDVASGIRGTFEYDRDLFDQATIDGMATRFERLLARLAEGLDVRLADLRREFGAVATAPAPVRSGPRKARRRAVVRPEGEGDEGGERAG